MEPCFGIMEKCCYFLRLCRCQAKVRQRCGRIGKGGNRVIGEENKGRERILEGILDGNGEGAARRAERVVHEFAPVFDASSRVLMLGTMPSPKSRETGFYYGHPRNRFWKVLADVCGEETPVLREDKIAFALRNHIAVWDVLAGCDIRGADDSSIRNPVPNDMNRILKAADIRAVYTTGTKAAELYKRYCYPKTGIEAVRLPSTSPANCRMSYEELYQAYAQIRRVLTRP